jgi:hypothetical protein
MNSTPLISRRSVLALLPMVGAMGCSTTRIANPRLLRPVGRRPPGPRYFIQIGLMGGMDAIYTTDPKTRAMVEPWVDVPFESSRIIATPYGEFGPCFAPLAPWAKRLAVFRGVQTHTVNHDHGTWQFGRMKRLSNRHMPLLLDVIGTRLRDSQPLALLHLSPQMLHEDTSAYWLSSITGAQGSLSLLEQLQALDHSALTALSAQVHRMSHDLAQFNRGTAAAQKVAQVGSLLMALQNCTPFERATWSAREGAAEWELVLQQALWAIENDISCTVQVHLPGWDSHANNDELQRAKGLLFGELLARFLDELQRRTNARGALLDQLVGVVGSELGRFPRLNVRGGKDHLPEAPFFFFGGAHLRPGIYGATDRRMTGRPLDAALGTESPTGHDLSIEHVGASLLSLARMNPELYGYRYSPLSFLEVI